MKETTEGIDLPLLDKANSKKKSVSKKKIP
jgi:hypothetical protein